MSSRNPFWTEQDAARVRSLSDWILPDDTLTPKLEPDGSIIDVISGTLTSIEVIDYISVNLISGNTYLFMSGSPTYSTSLSIYDNEGYLLIYTDGGDIGISEPTRADTIVNFKASYSGTYKLAVSWAYVAGIGSGLYSLGVTQTAGATVAPSLAISGLASIAEGNSGSTSVSYTVTRTGDLSAETSVAWAATGTGAAPVTADDFADNVLPTGKVTFAAGASTATIAVSIKGDTSVESNEQVRITLSSPTNGTLTTASVDTIITNDDVPPALTLTGTDAADKLTGGAANDTISGGKGHDTLIGGTGDDVISGGDGIDVAVITATSPQAVTISTADGKTIITSASGRDTLDGVEVLVINNDVVKLLSPINVAVVKGGLFDETFYLQQNPDVAAAVTAGALANGKDHFLAYGQAEGRNPNILFDAAFYLAKNPDIAAAVKAGVTTAWSHYQNYGWREGRDPSAFFDTSDYLSTHKDVGLAGINPLDHFLQYGFNEGRTIYLSDQAGILG